MRTYVLAGAVLAAMIGTTSGALAQASPAPAAPQGDAAAGKRAFIEYACYYCHGTVGQGSLPTIGPRIARVSRSVDNFRSYVRRPTGRMSSYPAGVISDDTLTNIYAYLRSLPDPSTPLPAALNQLRTR